ncbi:hypothetical protein AMK23_34565 [Streptomyces sp. CB02130]|uniref:hypothetical protein n=1 Tax=Streptomyces sp. CB02130 TaxID=1703934 RepID=UPI00093F43D8|nr:hypothetical protein [Streptomyces sp. CB02130]OKJ19408.1 hypothetical protein AMK23_34565 [Streptomyces sp. CB02130]
MSSAGIPQETTASSAVPDPSSAVLYVCADRGPSMPELASERAVNEGQEFAQQRGFRVMEVVTDPYGEPDPSLREGWQRVRALAAGGAVAVVLVRWPASIAPEATHEYRYRETNWLQEQGVKVFYTWAPLAASSEESRR